jgi:Cu+-exporting ATPase
MRELKLTISIVIISLLIISCKNENPEVVSVDTTEGTQVKTEIASNATIAKAEFTIEGMTCAMGCARTIEKKLSALEGVKSAVVDFDKKIAMVEYDEATVTPVALEETVKKTGETYSVSDMKTVDTFTNDLAKKACSPDCSKKDCDHKLDKTSSEGNIGVDMKGCKSDCKMACCTKKA